MLSSRHAEDVVKARIPVACLLVMALLQAGAARPGAAQQDSTSSAGSGQDAARPGDQAQPTFRGGIDFVTVDVIVTDRQGRPVIDLTEADFEVFENGAQQPIEQFRGIAVDGSVDPDGPPLREIRNPIDEETEAAREDVRLIAIFLDDYHVRLENSMSVRAPLIRFVQTQLQPQDMVGIMYPLTPVDDVRFTRDHAAVVRALERFEGRKYDYTPRNQQEYEYWRYPTEVVERIRNDVVMGALRGLAVRMGGLREGRKSVVFVSEGFTVMLPPQLRRADASMPANPFDVRAGAGAENNTNEITAEFFSESDLYSRMRDVFNDLNRQNTAVYSLDPRGLAVSEFGMADVPGAPPGMETDRRFLQATQNTLRTLSAETDGRAIVNRNSLDEGLAQVIRDSSYYYLLGYTSPAPADGKFHEIRVRVNRRDVQVRARRGYWAVTEADVRRATAPPREIATPVQEALASIAPVARSYRYVQTWVGTERGADGRTRVTFVWEPVVPTGGARREQPGRVSLLAADGNGDLVFRGRSPDAAAASRAPGIASGAGAAASGGGGGAGPQRIVFDTAPGKVELRVTVEAAEGGGALDNEIRTIDVPDLTGPSTALSTPRVYRSRTAREFKALAADATAVPVATREFSRTERLLIRFDTYGPGADRPVVTAALLNRSGEKMAEVPVSPSTAGGTHHIDLGLGSLPAGEYLVEITATGEGGTATDLVPLRVGS